MEDDEPQSTQSTGTMLTMILALATAVVAIAIGWVGWNCIDSVQKHTGKLDKFNVTVDNSKIDSHHLDIVKNEIDAKFSPESIAPSEDLQTALVKQEGSEVLYSQATMAIDNRQFAQAIVCYTKILAMVPAESKTKTTWYASGATADKTRYLTWVYRQRASCAFKEMKQYSKAISDFSEAIRLSPEVSWNYTKRAEVYYRMGKKELANQDIHKVQMLAEKYRNAKERSAVAPHPEELLNHQ